MYWLLIIAIFTLLMLQKNISCFGSGPNRFIPDNYGEKGAYYDNINLEPLYRKTEFPDYENMPIQ